tara:strand:- start:34 stop:450 length:417 start_codon:yes stop_codon:yes gene_type:complete
MVSSPSALPTAVNGSINGRTAAGSCSNDGNAVVVVDDVVVVTRSAVVVGRSRGSATVVVVTNVVVSTLVLLDAGGVDVQATTNGSTMADNVSVIACRRKGAIHLNSTEHLTSRRMIITSTDCKVEVCEMNRLSRKRIK